MAAQLETTATTLTSTAIESVEKQLEEPKVQAAQEHTAEKPATALAAPVDQRNDVEVTGEARKDVITPTTVPSPVAASEADANSSPPSLMWPETPADHPLTKFFEQIEVLTKEAAHGEIYGISLSPENEFHTKLILQKFLRANQNNLDEAKQQLLDTLKWRKEFNPTKAAGETFEKSRFEGLGWILQVEGVPESTKQSDIITFNIYGAVKDNKKTFGDLDAFLRWRVGLMERSVQHLSLSSATQPIPDFGAGSDPYQGFQVHDYLQVAFIRQDPLVKRATKKTIEILGRYYPETLSRKFFVNVPLVMGWVYQAAKMIVSKETAKKFTVLSYGNALAGELGLGLPAEYGGEKGSLSEVGEEMKLEE